MTRPATLNDLFALHRDRETPMLFDRGRPIAYAELERESQCLASGLRAWGVRRGDRVAIWLPNVPAWLACLFACARLGAVAVAVNTRFRSHELADIVGRSGAKLLLTWPGFAKVDFDGILAGVDAALVPALATLVEYGEDAAGGVCEPGSGVAPAPSPNEMPEERPNAATGESPNGSTKRSPRRLPGLARVSYASLIAHSPLAEDDGAPDAGCAIFTTSGTTKAPKFVLHDQRTLLAHAFDVIEGFGLHARCVVLLAPPLCGVFGVCNALATIAAGRPLLMAPAWDAAVAAREIVDHGVTHFNATDDAIAQLLDTTDRTPAFPTVAFVGYAAFNPARDDIVEQAQARGLTVVGLYGISEIQALFARQSEHAPIAERKLGGGWPVSALARVRARDPDSGRVLPHGEAGELEFLAPSSRMVGYFGNPQATAEATAEDGWYRSGDLGYTTDDGRFVFLTRIGDTLRLGGFLVSPLEIETLAQQVPGVDGCQVVGVTTPQGLRPVAFVTVDAAVATAGEPALEGAVIDHLSTRLARYKVPMQVFVIDAFPVTEGTNATKIQRHRLRDLAQRRVDAG